ncbi:hypothetical protein, partial [Streptomyces flaveolus]|uniref:hypothetical protein n=1 Tax=Streptomyces flaveolus TaxID=67297 RepID=UPI0033EACFD1
QVKSFLPVGPGRVRFYSTQDSASPGGIADKTVVASLGALAPFEDEANIFAVDGADVSLEAQSFPGIAGSPLCLVLNAQLGMLNTRMFNYNYSVHVYSRPDQNYNKSPIPTNQRPAGGENPDFEPPG